jgi:hypothetical protein
LQLTIVDVDYAPAELHRQTPIVVDLLREMPGDDRPDYWLGAVRNPIRWMDDNRERQITHLIVAARWQGTRIEAGARNLPVGIAFVLDQSLLDDVKLDFSKCRYVAIGISHESGGGSPLPEAKGILAGTIGRTVGKGRRAQ